MKRIALALLLVLGCGTSSGNEPFANPEGGLGNDATDGSQVLGSPDGQGGDGAFGADAGPPHDCSPSSQDMQGCSCPTASATRPCYTGDAKTRAVGACKDGAQTCTKNGEFASWSACAGSVTPATETCTGTVDSNCNGKVGCVDPACATDPACQTGCTNGQTRPCYDGPAGSENVGLCKDGTQTCVNGQWPSTCAGEVLPQTENCCDALDHNCNGLPGCFDFFSCLTSACCQSTCTQQNLDPGCVCPEGAGDTATCPKGDHDVHKGGFPGSDECCPCDANSCADPNCCDQSFCATAASCGGLVCKPLPPSCNGKVNADCDDFPEDCDEPCCLCTTCP